MKQRKGRRRRGETMETKGGKRRDRQKEGRIRSGGGKKYRWKMHNRKRIRNEEREIKGRKEEDEGR